MVSLDGFNKKNWDITIRISWDIGIEWRISRDFILCFFRCIFMGGYCGILVLRYKWGYTIRHESLHQARCGCNVHMGYSEVQWDAHTLYGKI